MRRTRKDAMGDAEEQNNKDVACLCKGMGAWLRPGDILQTAEDGNTALFRAGRTLRLGGIGGSAIRCALAVCAFLAKLLSLPVYLLTTPFLHLAALPGRYAYICGLAPYWQRLADFGQRLEMLLRRPAELCLFLLSGKSSAPAEGIRIFSGALRENTSWEGTISVCGDVVVPRGLTLTIKAGTKISFLYKKTYAEAFARALGGRVLRFTGKPRCKLYVRGALHVEGTHELPAVFEGAGAIVLSGGAKGALRHVLFENCTDGLYLFDSSSLHAAHCSLKACGLTLAGGARGNLKHFQCLGAKTAVRALEQARLKMREALLENSVTGISAENAARVTLRKVQVRKTDYCAVLAVKGRVSATHSDFAACGTGIRAAGSGLRLNRVVVSAARSCGVELSGGLASVNNSILEDCGMCALSLRRRAVLKMRASVLVNSRGAALLAEDASTAELSACRLEGNASGIQLRGSSADISETEFRDNARAHLSLLKSLAVLDGVNMHTGALGVDCGQNSRMAVNNLYINGCAQTALKLDGESSLNGYIVDCSACGESALSIGGGSKAELSDLSVSSSRVGMELITQSRAQIRRGRILDCAAYGIAAEENSSLELLGCELQRCGTALACGGGARATAHTLSCKDSAENAVRLGGGARLECRQLRLVNSGGAAIAAGETSELYIRDLEAIEQSSALLLRDASKAEIRGGLVQNSRDCGFSVLGASSLSLLSVGIFGGRQGLASRESGSVELEHCLFSGCETALLAEGGRTLTRATEAQDCPDTGFALSGGKHAADTLTFSNCGTGLALSGAASLTLDAFSASACRTGAKLGGQSALKAACLDFKNCGQAIKAEDGSAIHSGRTLALGPGQMGIQISGGASLHSAATSVANYACGLACEKGAVFESPYMSFTDNAAGIRMEDGSSISASSGRVASSASYGIYIGAQCRAALKGLELSGNTEYGLRAEKAMVKLEHCRFTANGTGLAQTGGELHLASSGFTRNIRLGLSLSGGAHKLDDADFAGGEIGLGLYSGAQAQAEALIFQGCQTGVDLHGASRLCFENAALRGSHTAIYAEQDSSVEGKTLAASGTLSTAVQAISGVKLRLENFEALNSAGTGVFCTTDCELSFGRLNVSGGKTGIRLEESSILSAGAGSISGAAEDGLYLGERCSAKLEGVEFSKNAAHGLCAQNASAELAQCRFSANGNGIFQIGGELKLAACAFADNKQQGLSLSGGTHQLGDAEFSGGNVGLGLYAGAAAKAGNIAVRNSHTGIDLRDSSRLELENATLHRCNTALYAETRASLSANTLLAEESLSNALRAINGVTATLKNFAAKGSGDDGISCKDNCTLDIGKLMLSGGKTGLRLESKSTVACRGGQVAACAEDGLYLGEDCQANISGLDVLNNIECGLRSENASAELAQCRFNGNKEGISQTGGELKLSACSFADNINCALGISGGTHQLGDAVASGGKTGLKLHSASAQAGDLNFQDCLTGMDLSDKASLTLASAMLTRCQTGLHAEQNAALSAKKLFCSSSQTAAIDAQSGAGIKTDSFEAQDCAIGAMCGNAAALSAGEIRLMGGATGLKLENCAIVECGSGKIENCSSDGIYLGDKCRAALKHLELSGNARHGLHAQNACAELEQCRFSSNETGISQNGGKLRLSACSFIGNKLLGLGISGGTHQLGNADFSGSKTGLALDSSAQAQAETLSAQDCETGLFINDSSRLEFQDAALKRCATGVHAAKNASLKGKSLKILESGFAGLQAEHGSKLELDNFEALDSGDCAASCVESSALHIGNVKLNGGKTGFALDRRSTAVCSAGSIDSFSAQAALINDASSLRLSTVVLGIRSEGLRAQAHSALLLEHCTIGGGKNPVLLQESSSETSFCLFTQEAGAAGTGTVMCADPLSRVESCRDHFSGYACALNLEGEARLYAVCAQFSDMGETALKLSGQALAKTESCRYAKNKISVFASDSAQYSSHADEFAMSETGIRLEGKARATLSGTLLKEHSTALLLWGGTALAESRSCRYTLNKTSLLACGDTSYSSRKDEFVLSETGLRLEGGAQAKLSATNIKEHHGTGLQLMGEKTCAETESCLYTKNKTSVFAESGARLCSDKDHFSLSGTGLRLASGAQAELKETVLQEHSEAGLNVWGNGSSAQTENCSYTKNKLGVLAGDGASYCSRSDKFSLNETGLHIECGARAALYGTEIKQHSLAGLELLGGATTASTENCRYHANKLSALSGDGAMLTSQKDEFSLSETGLRLDGGKALLSGANFKNHSGAGLQLFSGRAEACDSRFSGNTLAAFADSGAKLRLRSCDCSGNRTGVKADRDSIVSAKDTQFSGSQWDAVWCGTGVRLAALRCVFKDNGCGIKEGGPCRIKLCATRFEGKHGAQRQRREA